MSGLSQLISRADCQSGHFNIFSSAFAVAEILMTLSKEVAQLSTEENCIQPYIPVQPCKSEDLFPIQHQTFSHSCFVLQLINIYFCILMCPHSMTFRTKKQARKIQQRICSETLFGKTLKLCQYSRYVPLSILASYLTVVSTGIYFKTMLQYLM